MSNRKFSNAISISLLLLCVMSSSYLVLKWVVFPEKIRSRLDIDLNQDHNELDGCYHVYLDVGSNVGVQVRKLFEKDIFPKATISEWFDKYFGSNFDQRKATVCSIGFESNLHRTPALKKLEAAHEKCGYRSHFYSETAVGHDYGRIDVFAEEHEDGRKELGATIVKEKKNYVIYKIGTAVMIRLAEYVLQKVVTRKIPTLTGADTGSPAVIMKMDVEGSELELLSDLLISGALQHVDNVLIEYHPYFETQRNEDIKKLADFFSWLTNVGPRINLTTGVRVTPFDDESYFQDEIALPNC